MGLFDKLLKKAGPTWCKTCKNERDLIAKQLYFMPKTVSSTMPAAEDFQYFLDNLVPIKTKSEIPTSFCAAGLKRYRCPTCGASRDFLEVFMPVRGEERFITAYHFYNGELNSLELL